MAVLWQPDYSSAQATYDFSRLRLEGFIGRIDRTNICTGWASPLFTQLGARVIIPALTDLAAPAPLCRPRVREVNRLLRAIRLA